MEMDELLHEPLILSDATPFNRRGSSYQEVFYPAKKFRQLEGLGALIDEVRLHREWFSQPNVVTTERVADELARMDRMYRQKLKHLNRAKATRGRRKGLKELSEKSANQVLFEDLAFGTNKLARTAKNSLLHVARPGLYTAFVDTLTSFATENGVKRDYSERHGSIRRAQDLHADEELVGASLYLSVVERRPHAVVTSDHDLHTLLNYATHYLGRATTGSPRAERALATAPITLYIADGRQAEQRWSSRSPTRPAPLTLHQRNRRRFTTLLHGL